ncbi:MAG: hypothetical protein ACJ8G7_07075, partial [Rhizobacter sp.]
MTGSLVADAMRAPVSPGARLGFQLGLGALVLIGAAWAFGVIAEDVASRDRLTVLDAQVALWLHERTAPALTRLMLVVTDLHSTVAVSLYGSAAGLYLIARRQWRPLTTLV